MAGAHKIVPRWGQPLTGIIALIVFTLIAWVTWWIIGDPAKGIFKLYEQPFTAFLAVMIVVGVWQHIIFGDWPFQNLPPLQRGAAMTVTNIVLSWFLIYVFFEWLGKTILPIFSTHMLYEQAVAAAQAAGQVLDHTQLEHLHETAMETKMAVVTFWVVTGFVTYPFWTILFQKWPWAGKLPQPAAGMAEWAWTTVVTIIVFGMLVLPHFLGLKYPQAIAWPWWYDMAPKGAQNYYYIFAFYEWMVIWLFMVANVWRGYPWALIKPQPWRGLVGAVGTVVFAWIAVKVCLWGMDMWWGPMQAGASDIRLLPHFRYYHAATIAGCTIMPFLAWHHFFDDWPTQYGEAAGFFIRTIGVLVLAAVWLWIWYKISYPLFGLWPTLNIGAPNAWQLHELGKGAFQVMNKPLVWIFWWIIPLLFNEWFMHKWPFYVEEHELAKHHGSEQHHA